MKGSSFSSLATNDASQVARQNTTMLIPLLTVSCTPFTMARLLSLVLIPRLSTNPPHTDSGIGAHLYRGSFSSAHSLFNGLHQILCVSDQHVGGFLVLLRSLSAKHRRLDSRQNLQLRADSRNTFAHLQQVLHEINQVRQPQ